MVSVVGEAIDMREIASLSSCALSPSASTFLFPSVLVFFNLLPPFTVLFFFFLFACREIKGHSRTTVVTLQLRAATPPNVAIDGRRICRRPFHTRYRRRRVVWQAPYKETSCLAPPSAVGPCPGYEQVATHFDSDSSLK